MCIGNGHFRPPRKKKCIVHIMEQWEDSDCIKIRIPPPYLVINTIRGKKNGIGWNRMEKRYDGRKKEKRKKRNLRIS